jgi:hypothetical protein
MEFEFTFGVARTIVFPVIDAGTTNFAATGDWTPATGDTKISLDGGNVANTTNNPTAVGGTGSVLWSLALPAAELSAKVVVIQIVDSATKAVEDQCIVGYAKDSDKVEVYTVEDTDVSPSATAFQGNRGQGRSEEATAGHFNGRNILFLTGALQGKMTDITDYALTNSRGAFTVTSLGEAPADGDQFIVL